MTRSFPSQDEGLWKLGAHYLGDGRAEFLIFAPFPYKMAVKICGSEERLIPMSKSKRGYWQAVVDDIRPGTLYFYRLDGERDRPDPASRFQPQGVHGPSQVVPSAYTWKDQDWQVMPLEKMVIYEIHVGTFTPAGTFDALIPRLDELSDLGINALEIMPVSQFPGGRNWGYDGVFPFAPQYTYGGPEGLKGLVNECHIHDLALILDVVYNHFGPEGNYLAEFGPYFTDKYKTPWGRAVNFDDAFSDEVRRYFFQNAHQWLEEYHIDGLRLDAIHAICDMSAKPFLAELSEKVQGISTRKHYLIAESDLNDVRVVLPRDQSGYGFDGQWCDDFHHALHALLTRERAGYYADFGKVDDLVRSIRDGFVYSGKYSSLRKRSHGSSSRCIPSKRFIVFSQNHDHVGNRMLGERLSQLVCFEALKLAAGAVILSPYIPLLFMGQEYAESAPFHYFISHSSPDLVEAVRSGRKREFAAFLDQGDPPDPQSLETFERSRLQWGGRRAGHHGVMLDLCRELVRLRRDTPALANLSKDNLDACGAEGEKMVLIKRHHNNSRALCLMNFNSRAVEVTFPSRKEAWKKAVDTSEKRWMGPGSSAPSEIETSEKFDIEPLSFILYLGI
ncbi:MAG TPA: malto-oligosyltrehalose trehalohydrolase [Methanotrichaceae archaeon]|nr:malto-oligosyltrehalose trehalohydrolase [Methanotrichaceae archaeon]